MVSVLHRPRLQRSLLADIAKVCIADPACEGLFQPIFFFKGLQALTTHRVAHALWLEGDPAHRAAALFLQSRVAELYSVDIHPAATLGDGIMLDHASGVVIGATCILGDNITMLHSVTLGATGKPMPAGQKRHPTVGTGCTLGAGCIVLGDVTIGDNGTVGAAAVVTQSIPSGGTVIGVNNLLKRKDQTVGAEAMPQAEAAAVVRPKAAATAPPTRTGGPLNRKMSITEAFEFRLASLETATLADDHADEHTWFYDRSKVEVVDVYNMFGV